MVRCVERAEEGAFLVALERLNALSTVLGKAEVIAEIRGCCDLNCLSSVVLTSLCRIGASWSSLPSPVRRSRTRRHFGIPRSSRVYSRDV